MTDDLKHALFRANALCRLLIKGMAKDPLMKEYIITAKSIQAFIQDAQRQVDECPSEE